MKQILSILCLLLLLPPLAVSATEGSSRFDTDGEIIVSADAGNFHRKNQPVGGGTISTTRFDSSFLDTFLDLDILYARNVEEGLTVDVQDRLLGQFGAPQNPETNRFSELDHRFDLKIGMAHTANTASQWSLRAAHLRQSLAGYNWSDRNEYGAQLLVDHAWSANSFADWRFGIESMEYPHQKSEDYQRLHQQIKITRWTRAVGRTPNAFRWHLFEEEPDSVKREAQLMDIAWDLFMDFDQVDMRNRPDGDDYSELAVGANINLAISRFAGLRTGVSTTTRAHEMENLTRRVLNFSRNRLFAELDHSLFRDLQAVLYTDLSKYNHLNAPGSDINEFKTGAKFYLHYRPHIRWSVDLSTTRNSYEARTVFPLTDYQSFRSTWTRAYGDYTTFTWILDLSKDLVEELESDGVPSGKRVRTDATLTKRLTDDINLDLGLRLDRADYNLHHRHDWDDFSLHTATRWMF